jgi:para-nitrobenzyl esterase
MKYLSVLPLLACLLFSGHISEPPLDVVKTRNGLISGTKSGKINIFKGIPFAAPPVGELRWKAPQPAANWTGIRKCTAFPASPFQPPPAPFYCWTEEFIAPPEPLSEDCLYLNVWTGAKSSTEKRPVFVWIYGGGFGSGSAACAIYDGEEMAKQGLVYVSINYRVGPFGFMAHPELSKEQNGFSGNYGLMDQVAALRWVHDNIAAFGGDPGKVTIAGQSAGSMSVNSMIATPLAKGLFQRAIAQSGGILSGRFTAGLEQGEKTGLVLQEKAAAANLAALRQLPAADVLRAAQALGPLRLGPILDGYVLPRDIQALFRTGRHNDVPFMSGWVTGDGGIFGNQAPKPEDYQKNARDKYGAQAQAYLDLFPGNNQEEVSASLGRFNLLSFAGYPAHLLAAYNKSASFIYQVAHVPTDKPDFPNYGAFHTSEVPYALHTLHLWKRPWQDHDYAVEKLMSAYWVNFAKNGDPNGKGLPRWPKYTPKEGSILEINNTAMSKPALFKKEFDLMGALPQL